MSVHVSTDAIHLEGRCLVEDAETLLVALQQNPGMPIDVGSVQRLHMAVVQVLLALTPPVAGCSGRSIPFTSHFWSLFRWRQNAKACLAGMV
jgi:hypothetical protein